MVMLMFALIIAFLTDAYVREIIQEIFKWSTDNRIKFIGKGFEFYASDYYYLAIGMGFFFIAFDNVKRKSSEIIVNSLVALILFCAAVFTLSTIDASLKVAECTSCDDGILELQKNAVNYDLIVIVSVLIAIIPNLFRITKMFIKLYRSYFS